MRPFKIIAGIIGFGIWGCTPATAGDVAGKWGVSGQVGAALPLGQQSVKDQAQDTGTDLGGSIHYGLSPHWRAGLSYDNIGLGHGIRVEPIDAVALYHFLPEKRWTPTALLGAGVGRGVDSNTYG